MRFSLFYFVKEEDKEQSAKRNTENDNDLEDQEDEETRYDIKYNENGATDW